MKRLATGLLVAALVVACAAGPAQAQQDRAQSSNKQSVAGRLAERASDVAVGTGWIRFRTNERGSFSRKFLFTAPGPVLVTVTDYLCSGDRYRVFDNDEDLGLTSVPLRTRHCEGSAATPNKGLADPDFTHGVFPVGAGHHVLRFQIVRSPYGGAVSAFRLDPAPTPDSRDDCKNGGWRGLYTRSAVLFSNQGRCVSSVAHA
jgi:hypothetical protein